MTAVKTSHKLELNDPCNDPQPLEFDFHQSIETISHWLPTQGPIKDFIHHNTLHMVQHHPFHEGVAIAAKTLGARSYLPLADYQHYYREGRIDDSAIDWAINHSDCDSHNKAKLRASLFIEDHKSHYPPVSLANHGIRDFWLTRLEIDLNGLVHPVLFRLLANFMDQGISRWTLPQNGERFWQCVWRLTQNSLLPLYPFHEPTVRTLLDESPDKVIIFCLEKIVGSVHLYEQYMLEMLLAHPGWAGMVRLVELNPQCLLASRKISLKEMIAVELACELAFLYLKLGHQFKNIANFRIPKDFPLLNDNIVIKPKVPLRLKIWHEALERTLHAELLTALTTQQDAARVKNEDNTRPKAQALFCIDDRECSLRRHLEELDPELETFGAAGFFGIDFLYQGLDDAYPVAQCPVVVTPKHLIRESSLQTKKAQKPVKNELSKIHMRPHSLFRGWLYTQTLGIGYAARLAWNVLWPGKELPKIRRLSEVKAHTHLHLLRENDEPDAKGRLLGFSFREMADRIENLLRTMGLTQNFAPLIIVVAHGSSSVNNPHFAAYDCGACSGKPGAPNARAFAWMANHETVRQMLRERNIDIPDDTYFVAALHNTSRDEITYFDPHLFEPKNPTGLDNFQSTMQRALALNALERCRWFELGPQTQSLDQAHDHVRKRASSIFEPRPEYNHSNNLYCVVGRRSLTCHLFLDRRAFLHSYDPGSDPQGEILVKILSAIIPVCGGINLEYLFSRIDNSVYGAGTKLPHNVIGLLGVANGVEGDLRTGLPSQMIEVHEPARLLIVIEQSREIIEKTLAKVGNLREWVDNEWVRFACCDPVSGNVFYYSNLSWEAFDTSRNDVTPVASCSKEIIAEQIHTIPVHQFNRSPS